MPLLGFGTWLVDDVSVIQNAINAGYRLIDTASYYGNEWIVGDCLKHQIKSMPRKDLFIVTKAWNDAVYDGPAALRYFIQKSLQDLRCDYIDLFMIHWPVPGKFTQIYPMLEEMVKCGKIVDIGISNFTIEDYEELKQSGIGIL
jgi:methylglyoxal/glyoxal reductase